MTADYVQMLYAYNEWANHRIFERLETVSREKLMRDLGSSYPSIRDTLVHLIAAEWVWLSRWRGASPSSFPDTDALRDVASIRERCEEVERELASFVQGVTDERLRSDLSYSDTKGRSYTQPLGEQMCHLVNHSTYHRGQITTMLRQLDEVPVSTDMIVYLRN